MAQSVGAVALDIVAGKNTLNSTLKSAMGEAQNTANSGSSGISNALGKIGSVAGTVAKTVGAGMVAAGAAVVAVSKSAVSSYADYEQLVGGVETLFKDSANTVIENASKAYTTAGMSANEYMTTVTSFSASLLQSLGNDTVKAAEKADMAIVDMSDNANKMGTSMEMIQNAYQGFAKQNYTMLDNLKLGYGGTKEEMQRLLADAEKISGIKYDISSYADIVDAIHVVQTEMGITGTTAKEASTTISGSLASMKSAWQNVLTGMGDETQDFGALIDQFVASVETVGENLLPRIEVVLGGVVNLVQGLAPKIIEKIPSLISQLLPPILSATTSLIQAVVAIIPDLVNLIVAQAPVFIDACIQIVSSVIQSLPMIVESLASALPTLLPIVISGIVDLILLICQVLPQIIQPIIDNLPIILESLITGILSNLPILVQGLIDLVVALTPMIPEILNILLDSILVVFTEEWASTVFELIPVVVVGIGQLIVSLVKALPSLLLAVVKAIGAPFIQLYVGATAFFKDLWEVIGDSVSTAIQFIASLFDAGLQIIALPFSFIWENCKEYVFKAIDWIKEKVQIGFDFIKEKIINPITDAKDSVSGTFDSVKLKISNVVNSIKTTVTDIFNNIRDAMQKPIESAKNKIKDIIDTIKGFFSGMKLSFPNIKLPHFSIEPSGWKIGDLLEGSIPKLSIDWYAKAMNKPMIMTKPTIFGYDAGAGKLLGGGEAGSELVVGTNTLLNMIRSAVSSVLGGFKMRIEVPALQNVRGGSSNSDIGLSDKIDRLIELFKLFIESGDADMTVPIYIGNELIDEYILNKSNRNVLRSGGHA